MSVSDSSFFFDFPLIVDLPRGIYAIEVFHAHAAGHDVIERLRIADGVPGDLSRGDSLGFVAVHFAQLGLCDRTRAESAFDKLDEVGLKAFTSQLSLVGSTGLATFPDGTPMLLVKPGFGDLDSAAFELLRDDQRRGVELVFVEPEARAPT